MLPLVVCIPSTRIADEAQTAKPMPELKREALHLKKEPRR
jgi:hypothetical protein